MRTNRYSMSFAPPSYRSISGRKSSKQVNPVQFAFASKMFWWVFCWFFTTLWTQHALVDWMRLKGSKRDISSWFVWLRLSRGCLFGNRKMHFWLSLLIYISCICECCFYRATTILSFALMSVFCALCSFRPRFIPLSCCDGCDEEPNLHCLEPWDPEQQQQFSSSQVRSLCLHQRSFFTADICCFHSA